MKSPLSCLLLLLLACPLVVAAEQSPIGHIRTVSQEALIVRNNKQIAAIIDAPIYQGDRLVTRFEAGMGIVFEDGGVLTLGPSTLFEIDEYTFQPEQRSASFLTRIRRGTVAFLAGAIGRIAPDSIRFTTPSAVLAMHESKVLIRVD